MKALQRLEHQSLCTLLYKQSKSSSLLPLHCMYKERAQREIKTFAFFFDPHKSQRHRKQSQISKLKEKNIDKQLFKQELDLILDANQQSCCSFSVWLYFFYCSLCSHIWKFQLPQCNLSKSWRIFDLNSNPFSEATNVSTRSIVCQIYNLSSINLTIT